MRARILAVALAAIALPLAALGVLRSGGSPEPLALGVAVDDAAAFDAFARTVGVRPGMYQWYQGWEGSPPFDRGRADGAVSRGALPLLTWEPWIPGGGSEQPQYALARVVDGSHDGYVRAFAEQVRDWGGTLAMRFAHELDARHYPWSVGVNGNTAEHAVAAWRHVRAIFEQVGATNVLWIWCVNVHAEGTPLYEKIYPGDDAVDWVAVDGYNGGEVLPWGGWREPEAIFGASVEDLREITDKPLLITETASVEQGGDKAAWIRALFAYARDAGIRGIVWFDYAKEADWRVTSSPAAAAAMRAEASKDGAIGPPPVPGGLRPPPRERG